MINFIKQNTKTLAMHRATNFMIAAFILASLLAYMYFAHVAVQAVTALEVTRKGSQNLAVKVSELEARRLALEEGLTIRAAGNLGFVEVSRQTFIVNKLPKTARLDF